MKYRFTALIVYFTVVGIHAQSRNFKNYSDSPARVERIVKAKPTPAAKDDEVVRVDTDLVIVPVRLRDKDGRSVPDVKQSEFRIVENDVEQEVAYFQNEDQPFTVALLLDMSYSTVFKLHEIQAAADLFVSQLRTPDKVTVIAFDEKVRVLCKPTSDQRVMRLAIESTQIGSGTSLYTAIDAVINEQFSKIEGRKAVVVLSDGVDTSSKLASARRISEDLTESDILVYPIRYDTYDDVQKTRRKDMPIQYDEDDRPYRVEQVPTRGERPEDYRQAREFFADIADRTGGRVYNVNSNTNLKAAFNSIAEELRKTYSLGYYPSSGRIPGETYTIKVRVYRPNLIVRARESRLSLNAK